MDQNFQLISPEEYRRLVVASRTRPDYDFRCGRCGAPHWLDTSIDSKVWNQFANPSDALCLLCIDNAVAELGLTDVPAHFYFSGRGVISAPYTHESKPADALRAWLFSYAK